MCSFAGGIGMTSDRARLLYWLGAAAVLVLALAMRLGAVNNTVVDSPLRADARDYYSYALNLKFHRVFSRATYSESATPAADAVRAPGYPLWLVPLVSYPPDTAMITRITRGQALLDCLTVLLALAVFRRFMGAGWALGAALLTAVSPHLISMTTYVLTETLFTFLTMLSVWLVMRCHASGSRVLAVAAGLAIAAAALTRPTLQYFIVPSAGLLMWYGWRSGRLRLAVPLVLGFVLLFTPWQVRNVVQTGAMSDPTLATNALHHGMYPDFRYQDRPESTGFPYHFNPRNEEFSTSQPAVLAEIGRRFREEPARHLQWYLFGKPATLLSWNILAGMGEIFIYPVSASPFLHQPAYLAVLSVMKQLHWPLVILALCGTLLAWLPAWSRRLPEDNRFTLRLLSLLMLYFIALHMVGAPFPRYGIPLRPVIYGLALSVCAQCATLLAGVLSRPHPQTEHA